MLALLSPPMAHSQPPNFVRIPVPQSVRDAGPELLERLPPVETAPRLRLADVEQLAMQHNPSIARAAADVETARGEWLQTGLYPNPKVGVGQQQTGSRGRAEQDGVAFQQEFVLGHKLQLNRAISQHAVLQAEHQLAAQEIRVRTDARIAFYQALTARRQTELTAELVRIAQLGVDNARRQNKGTDIGENDVLEARIELHRAEIEVRNAANRHAAAWRSLAAVVGLRDLPQQELDGRLEDVPQERTWEGVLQTTLQTSPEIAAVVASRDRALATLRRAGVEMIPNVTVDGLVNWRDNGIDGKTDGGFLVSLPLPVWNRNQGGVARSRGEVLAAEQVIQQLELSLQNRLAPVFERYANAHFQVGQFRELILPEAAGALALTRKNYEVGLVEYVDLLTSQRTNAQVNIDYLKALGELWIAESELAGMTLTGSLGGQ